MHEGSSISRRRMLQLAAGTAAGIAMPGTGLLSCGGESVTAPDVPPP